MWKRNGYAMTKGLPQEDLYLSVIKVLCTICFVFTVSSRNVGTFSTYRDTVSFDDLTPKSLNSLFYNVAVQSLISLSVVTSLMVSQLE